MSSNLIQQFATECSQLTPSTLLDHLTTQQIPTHIKIAKLQCLRQTLRCAVLRLGQLSQLQRKPKQQSLSTCLTELSESSSEGSLWQQIDRLEEQIVEARQTKIQLSQTLDYYEEEMAEMQAIRDGKHRFSHELADQVNTKRKKIEVNRSWSYEADKLQKTIEGAAGYWRHSIRHFLG